jgi:phosphatidate cytidylyltransferase
VNVNKSKNLVQRLLFAAWAVPLGWWAINSTWSLWSLMPPGFMNMPNGQPKILPGEMLAVALTFGASVEYTQLLEASFRNNGFWLGYLWLSLMMLTYLIGVPLPTQLGIYLLLMLVAFEAFLFGKKTKRRWNRASLLFSGNVFMYISGIALLRLYQEPFQFFFRDFGSPTLLHIGSVSGFARSMVSQMGIVLVVGATFLCDTGAYVAGTLWGRHHFSSISPNKTVEGAVGGFVVAVAAAIVGWFFFARPQYSIIIGIPMAILIGIFAQLGDLLVSLIKRYFNVKNASELIPGHGGILDRFGSIFFVAPVVWLYFWLINRIVG